MYRNPPALCAICRSAVQPADCDVIETGLRCRRCTAAAELAAIEPALAEVREAQAEHRARVQAAEQAQRRSGCSKHEQWDTHCFWCVFGSNRDDDF